MSRQEQRTQDRDPDEIRLQKLEKKANFWFPPFIFGGFFSVVLILCLPLEGAVLPLVYLTLFSLVITLFSFRKLKKATKALEEEKERQGIHDPTPDDLKEPENHNRDQQVLEVVKAKNGRVTLSEIVLETGFSVERAQYLLKRFLDYEMCQLKEGGGLKIYVFPEFIDESLKEIATSLPQRITQIAEESGGRVTIAQVALETGLALEDVQEEFEKLLRNGGCQLELNEDGVLSYRFSQQQTSKQMQNVTVPQEQNVLS